MEKKEEIPGTREYGLRMVKQLMGGSDELNPPTDNNKKNENDEKLANLSCTSFSGNTYTITNGD